ncbi:hypothetical protein [Streptomyces sp. A012304]|uniref:hypothetical protein n=1 Tax=Streptomyces sp. A012304 TaxID=375446 RepID=UPI0022329C7A|nr:hypothetical protein [Streptomyces sp. A012304]GKQ33587.1 hypothetical protein ALMP_01380 [Streptomyces sp. A012304]
MRTTDGSAHAMHPVPLPDAGSRNWHAVPREWVAAAHPAPFTIAGSKASQADYCQMGTWEREGLERGAHA